MKAMPEALRQIVRDLVEKRLWPFAVLLLALAIVVPVLIGRSAPEAADPAAVAAGPAGAAPVAIPPTADQAGVRPKGRRGGKINDPFYDPPAAPGAEAAGTTAVAPAGDGTAPAAGKSAATTDPTSPAATPQDSASTTPQDSASTTPQDSASTTPQDSASTTPQDSATTAPERARTAPASVYYRAVMRWGTSTLAEPHAISRLTPLGGRSSLAALYLGMTRSDATYAIFVLGPNATSRGDGRCRAGTNCRMIGLQAGDTQRFTVRAPDGGKPRRFTLRVDVLRAVRTSPTAAAQGRARVHRAGRSVLRAMWRLPTEAAVLGRATYDQRSGLLRATRAPDDVEQAAK